MDFTIAGALFIFAGIIANMHIFFRPTSLFDTIVILTLLVGGLGLIRAAFNRTANNLQNDRPLQQHRPMVEQEWARSRAGDLLTL